MTVPEPKSVVPRNVYDFVERIREEKPALMSSVAGMVKLAREEKEREVANWIKLNPISYGVGYWNGFIPDDADEDQPETDEKPARKRKRIPPKEVNDA